MSHAESASIQDGQSSYGMLPGGYPVADATSLINQPRGTRPSRASSPNTEFFNADSGERREELAGSGDDSSESEDGVDHDDIRSSIRMFWESNKGSRVKEKRRARLLEWAEKQAQMVLGDHCRKRGEEWEKTVLKCLHYQVDAYMARRVHDSRSGTSTPMGSVFGPTRSRLPSPYVPTAPLSPVEEFAILQPPPGASTVPASTERYIPPPLQNSQHVPESPRAVAMRRLEDPGRRVNESGLDWHDRQRVSRRVHNSSLIVPDNGNQTDTSSLVSSEQPGSDGYGRPPVSLFRDPPQSEAAQSEGLPVPPPKSRTDDLSYFPVFGAQGTHPLSETARYPGGYAPAASASNVRPAGTVREPRKTQLGPKTESTRSKAPSSDATSGFAIRMPEAVPKQEKLDDRAVLQRMRNADMMSTGASRIEDQGVAFMGRQPIDAREVAEILRDTLPHILGQIPGFGRQATAVASNTHSGSPRERARDLGHRDGTGRVPVNQAPQMPGAMLAMVNYRDSMHLRLQQSITQALRTRLRLPEGLHYRKIDPKVVKPYTGSAKFSELENWLLEVVNHFEGAGYGGPELDSRRVAVLSDFLDTEAKTWYLREVRHVNRQYNDWTFESVIMGLYDRFVLPSSTQDAREKFDDVTFDKTQGIQGLYETLEELARNMSIHPDEHVMLSRFLEVIPSEMREDLILKHKLSPEVHRIGEFVAAAKEIEEASKTLDHYNKQAARRNGLSEPGSKELNVTSEPKMVKASSPRSPALPRSSDNKPVGDRARTPAEKSKACHNCGNLGHWKAECKLSPKRDYVRAAHTEAAALSDCETDGSDKEHDESGDEYAVFSAYGSQYNSQSSSPTAPLSAV